MIGVSSHGFFRFQSCLMGPDGPCFAVATFWKLDRTDAPAPAVWGQSEKHSITDWSVPRIVDCSITDPQLCLAASVWLEVATAVLPQPCLGQSIQ
jgi:hypothetical protein